MTWTTPTSSNSPGGAPLLPPGPLTLGDIAGGAWRVYKARFGLFLKLLIMPFLIMFAATVLFGLAMTAMALSSLREMQSGTMPPAFFALLAGFYIAMLVISLLLYVYQGRTVIAGIDLATGRTEPTGQNLADRTRGMLGRVVILMLLAFALTIAALIVFAVVMIPIAMSGSGSGSGGSGAGVLVGALLMIAVYVALIWFSIKITYVIPAMAEEQLDAIPAIKRSFQLTRGAFWRTFGYQIVLGLIALAILLIPYLIMMSVIMGSAMAGGEPSGGAVFGMGIVFLLMYAVMLLFVPYSYLFTGLMYLGRGRELGGSPTQYPPTTYPPSGTHSVAGPAAGAPYAPQRAEGLQYPQNPWEPRPTGGGSSPQA